MFRDWRLLKAFRVQGLGCEGFRTFGFGAYTFRVIGDGVSKYPSYKP